MIEKLIRNIRSYACASLLTCSLAPTFLLHSPLAAENILYENLIIEKIDIIVVNSSTPYDTIPIRARIKSKEGEFFSQSDFDNDLKRLSNDFDRIDPVIEYQEGKIFITLKISPKPTVRNITIEGNRTISTSRLLSELTITPCSVFDRRAFNEAFHKLKAYYVGKGFFEAQLNYEIQSNPDANEVDIQIFVNEGRAGRIKQLTFVNFTPEEEEELREQMVSKRYNLFLSWMTEEGTYREEMIQQDELTILNYLQDKGYADARVHIDVTEACQSHRIIVTITADRGERYCIGRITVRGNTLFSEEEVRACLLSRPGSSYSPETLRETIDRITTLYGRSGYIDANIDYEPKLTDDPCIYDIEFTIEECQQYRVGLIRVFGNCWTQTNVILHETILVPGETFNLEKLKKTEERLLNTRFFKSVNVYPVKSESGCTLGDNFRDVNIEVEEGSTGHFGAFFGFSTAEDLFGGFNISEDNFNAAGIPCVWTKGLRSLRGGGEFAHFTATFGTQNRSYVLSWSKPFFMDSIWTVGFDIENSSNHLVSKEYTIDSTGFTLKGIRPINQFVRFGVHYRIENSHVDLSGHLKHKERHLEHELNESSISPNEQREDEHKLEGINRLEEEARNSGLISAVGMNWIYDSTNNPIRPTRGWKSKYEFEYVGLGGSHTFLTLAYLNAYYYSFPDAKGVFRLRGDFRFIQPLWGTAPHDIPLEERYFMGGDYLIRGYRPYRVGPRYSDDDPRGGISLQFLSMEYSRFIMKRAELFVFADAGHLSMRRWNVEIPRLALGYGTKIYIFEGAPPLMFGMGYPVNPRDKSEVKRFFLTVGGRF